MKPPSKLPLAQGTNHQTAQAGVRKSVEEPAKVNRYNVDETVNVLKASRKHEIDHVVVASSSSVYGKPEYLPYDEDHPTTPVSPYGVSKPATKQYARVYSEIYGRIEKPDNTI